MSTMPLAQASWATSTCGYLVDGARMRYVGRREIDYGTAQDVARRDRVLLAAHAGSGGTHFAVCERRAVREPRGVTEAT